MTETAEAPEAASDDLMEKVVRLCRTRGFIFPSAEIYGGFRSTYDYGPLGVNMLRNVKNAWWRAMVQLRDDVVGLDAAILGPPAVWAASGHLATFTDPLVDCRNCHERWRADKIEGVCPNCGSTDLTEARAFNLMFKTHAGPGGGRGARGLPASRDGAGHVHQLRQRAGHHAQEAALRHRAGRQVLPQRDHAAELRLPHPRVRADGDGVLRPARREPEVVRLLAVRAHGVVPRPRHPAREAPPAPPRAERAVALLARHGRRRVPLPLGLGRARGHRQPGRLRPHGPRQGVGGVSSTTSTSRPTSATRPT